MILNHTGGDHCQLTQFGPSISPLRTSNSSTCADVSLRRAGPSGRRSTDALQGVQLATMQKLATYWATDYDWSGCEAQLAATRAQGGDWGAIVTDIMGVHAAPELLGVRTGRRLSSRCSHCG